MTWCVKRTSIYLAEGQAAALDRIARAEGVSRAELIREMIGQAIDRQTSADLAADLAAIEESFASLAGDKTFAPARDKRLNHQN
jgi:metal-responsive CopG/Arc/MetJ family transcriptional regulator